MVERPPEGLGWTERLRRRSPGDSSPPDLREPAAWSPCDTAYVDFTSVRNVQSADQGLTLFQIVKRLGFTQTLEQNR